MTIEQLTRRKAELSARLKSICMVNVYGQSIDAVAEIELDKANTMRELYVIDAKITDYICGKDDAP